MGMSQLPLRYSCVRLFAIIFYFAALHKRISAAILHAVLGGVMPSMSLKTICKKKLIYLKINKTDSYQTKSPKIGVISLI